MDIVITDWALDSYLELKHERQFSADDYRHKIRPDVLLLKTFPGSPKFGNDKFWSPAGFAGVRIAGGFKMKWHQLGEKRVQLRLPVGMMAEAFFSRLRQGRSQARSPAFGVVQGPFGARPSRPIHGTRGVVMNAIRLAPVSRVEIVEIGHQMNEARLPKRFVADAVSVAFELEGAHDLLKLWAAEDDPAEREEIIADIQELIDDCGQAGKVEGVAVRFDDLDAIAKDITAFKDHLRALVDKQGGVKRLAGLTGIPQPSLSRFFNTATMPRRTTLHKIARVLKLSEVEIASGWSR